MPAGTFCQYFYSGVTGDYPDSRWSDWYDNAYAGGGGAFRFVVKKVIENAADNPIEATCRADSLARWEHAMWDTRVSNAKALATGGTLTPSGSLVKVSYDDGGTEVWQVSSPFFSANLLDVPVPNTLKCP